MPKQRAKTSKKKPVKESKKKISQKEPEKKIGRPTDFTQKIADFICEMLADGHSLRTICACDEMPNRATVFRWLVKDKAFSDQYTLAREEQIETKVDLMNEIADDGSNDWMKSNRPENPGYILNGEAIQRSKLRIDAIKWQAGKLKPKKYGDSSTLKGDPENPLNFNATIQIIPVKPA